MFRAVYQDGWMHLFIYLRGHSYFTPSRTITVTGRAKSKWNISSELNRQSLWSWGAAVGALRHAGMPGLRAKRVIWAVGGHGFNLPSDFNKTVQPLPVFSADPHQRRCERAASPSGLRAAGL